MTERIEFFSIRLKILSLPRIDARQKYYTIWVERIDMIEVVIALTKSLKSKNSPVQGLFGIESFEEIL